MPVPYSAEELRAATRELVTRNKLRSCYIRPIVNRGYGTMGLNPLEATVDVAIACWEWGSYLGEEGTRDGVRAKVSSWRRIGPDSLIPHAKASGQYLNNVLAKVESLKAGYEEAILLDEHGHVCEGTGENVYVVRDGEIATPGQHNSILDGITRRSIIQLATRPRLHRRRAQRGARGALPRRRGLHDGHRGGARAGARDRRSQDRQGKPGEITRVLQDAFNDAIYGRSERYREWLDPVEVPAAGAAGRPPRTAPAAATKGATPRRARWARRTHQRRLRCPR